MNELDNFMHSTAHDLSLIINSVGSIERLLQNFNYMEPRMQRWINNIKQAQKDIIIKQIEFYKENIGKFKKND